MLEQVQNTTSIFLELKSQRVEIVEAEYYGETRMAKLSSRPASLCYPSQLATLEARRHANYSPRRPPRRRSNTEEVGNVPSNKEQHPLYPKIHIPFGNPGMYPECPPTTTVSPQSGEPIGPKGLGEHDKKRRQGQTWRPTIQTQLEEGRQKEPQLTSSSMSTNSYRRHTSERKRNATTPRFTGRQIIFTAKL